MNYNGCVAKRVIFSAEELEHVSDERLADRLDRFLEYRNIIRTATLIPKANGKLPKAHSVTLSELKPGATGRGSWRSKIPAQRFCNPWLK